MKINLSRLMEVALGEIFYFGIYEQPNIIIVPMSISHWRPIGKFAPSIRNDTMMSLNRRGLVDINGRFAKLTDSGIEKAKELEIRKEKLLESLTID